MEQFGNFNRVMEAGTISKNGASLKSQMSRRNIVQKTLLFFAALCVSIASTFAQDVITLKNGNDIQALVQEIGELDVKYKKFDNPNGPNYTLKKSEIFMIRYANGSKDVFADNTTSVTTTPTKEQRSFQGQIETSLEPLSIQDIKIYDSNGAKLSGYEIRNTMKNVPAALGQYNSGRALRGVGIGFAIPQFIFLGAGLGTMISGDTSTGSTLCLASVGCGIPAIIFLSVGNKQIKNSVGTYNRGIKQKQTSDISLNFGITQSGGIGLALNF